MLFSRCCHSSYKYDPNEGDYICDKCGEVTGLRNFDFGKDEPKKKAVPYPMPDKLEPRQGRGSWPNCDRDGLD